MPISENATFAILSNVEGIAEAKAQSWSLAVDKLTAALSSVCFDAERHAGAVPSGWTLVPVEATAEMLIAGERWSGLPAASWRDMLDAAPPPPAAVQEPVAVKVKQLDWIKSPLATTLSRAQTITGTYRVWSHHEAEGRWFWALEASFGANGEGDTEDEVKAVCQSLFEKDVRSALSPSQSDSAPGLENDSVTLRNYCQQLLDIIQNYDVEIEGEDNDLIAHISEAVDPAHAGDADNG